MSKPGKIWSQTDILRLTIVAIAVVALSYVVSTFEGGSFLVLAALNLLILYVVPIIVILVVYRIRRSGPGTR